MLMLRGLVGEAKKKKVWDICRATKRVILLKEVRKGSSLACTQSMASAVQHGFTEILIKSQYLIPCTLLVYTGFTLTDQTESG